MYKVYPYNLGSRSATRLARALDTLKVRENGRYRPRPNHTIINWGNPRVPDWAPWRWEGVRILNYPHAVRVSSNKHLFFDLVSTYYPDVLPEWTTDAHEAYIWNTEREWPIIARRLLCASSGRGIDYYEPCSMTERPIGSLFTRYIKKRDEYRVHVLNGEVIHLTQKRLRNGIPEDQRNTKIRSHDNGYVYCIHDVEPHEDVYDVALKAMDASSLTFGAVDVIWNSYHELAKVLEINTAPGLESDTTLNHYVNAFRRLQ